MLDPETWPGISAAAGLWLAVVGSGLYHGVNPGMGWPLAVSAALMGRGQRDLLAALGPLALGHFLAMSAILLPFAAMATLVYYQREIQIGAGLLVIGMGIFLLIYRRHPRFLARIKPTQLTFWSFAVAMAHGAGLMLVPIYLGLCRVAELDAGHQAAYTLMRGNLSVAVAVSVAHTVGDDRVRRFDRTGRASLAGPSVHLPQLVQPRHRLGAEPDPCGRAGLGRRTDDAQLTGQTLRI
jgi:hypothetical protein